MIRISKEYARKLASEITGPKKAASEALKLEFEQAVTDQYKAQLPKEVVDVFKKNPSFFCLSGSIRLHGHGFNNEYVSVVGENVLSNMADNYAELKLDKVNAGILFKMMTKAEKERKKSDDFFYEVRDALISLRTFNAVRKALPEAIPFLPADQIMALQINYSSLRHKIANQQPVIQ